MALQCWECSPERPRRSEQGSGVRAWQEGCTDRLARALPIMDPMTTMVGVDRLVHHAIVLEFDGETHRVPTTKEKSDS
jgi:hypothetical protein